MIGHRESIRMDRREQKQIILIILTIAMMVFIFIQSALPGDLSSSESNVIVRILAQITGADPQTLSFGVRKAAHFTEYMILGGLLMADAAAWRRSTTDLKRPACAWAIAALYAVSDEIHQYFVPGRVCALMDMGIDSAGAAAGVLIIYFIYRKKTNIKLK